MQATTVGPILRRWRADRGVSQLNLALAAGVSSRHISFIETGRSAPSRPMVLRLASTLDLPLRDRNSLLIAAGFAPVFSENELGSTDLAPIRRALETVLRGHEPFPAFVLDRGWNIVLANRAHQRILPLVLPAEVSLPDPVNVMQLVFDPDLVRPKIRNWELVAQVLGQRVDRQLRSSELPVELAERFQRLLAYPGVREAISGSKAPVESSVMIPLELEVAGRRTSWFSTLATFGTPRDVTVEELCIESMFPADDPTERLARGLA